MVSDKRNREYSTYLDSWTKRCFDIVMCLLLLPPSLIAVGLAGLTILIRDGRPVFFIHRRAGKNGKLFWMPKLRTLRVEANPYKPSAKYDDGPLVTKTGKFLRNYRLDELPQLFSVLTGHMSLVGPRPELANIVATYKSLHKKRLLTKPGVTGLWQVMGNHRIAMHRDMKYDLYYLRKAGLWLDIKILVMTVLFILKLESKKNTYENRLYTHNISLSK